VNCNHFEANIDRYLDGLLDPDAWRYAQEHTASCATCGTLVAQHQQASALLKTAVTDRVAAVDVSGLWGAIERQIGPASRTPVYVGARTRTRTGVLERIRDWAAQLTPVRVGAAMATAAAAVALLVASLGTETTPERLAKSGGATRMKSKAVRIETLEVPSGYTVSTWSRPRTRTHMIAINPTSPAYTYASVSR
jgi:anti-sigma factor RsiW